MNELIAEIRALAKTYLTESDDGDDSELAEFPLSIVNFVFEYALKKCNFPKHFTDERKVNELSACKNSLAMACVDLYLKIGTEGQNSYSSNGVTRNFKYDWINASLLENLPNYVRTI